MQQHEIHEFLHKYFTTNDCEVLESTNNYLTAQLTIDMDKKLMNRPFYWHYLEKTGGTPQPMKLTLITNKNDVDDSVKGEIIYFGSPRLHQIFRTTKELASNIRLYEDVKAVQGNTPLYPWLGLNLKISYICDRKKDKILSLGLHLINGTIVQAFHESILKLNMTPKIPDYCFTITPIIKPQSGINRIENIVKQLIQEEDHSWAVEAKNRMKEDLNLIEAFYKDHEELPESYFVEEKAIIEQYEPKIDVSIINGGLFYLQQHAI